MKNDYALPAKHSPLLTYSVLGAALLIIGAWTFFTQAGLMGKADAVGYAICHRIEVRSFQAFGRALPLCARCTGIYLGVITGLGVYVASGRSRAGYLPHWRLLIPLGAFVGVMGVDGLNSYLSLFPGYTPVYQPQNWLRLLTGLFCGLTLVTLVFPIFSQSVWHPQVVQKQAPLQNLKELAGMCGLLLLMAALTLAQNGTILLVLGFLSALGVVSILSMIFSVMMVTVWQTFQSYSTWAELRLPLLAGLTLAIAMIGTIDYLRYTLTGTWGGFVF